MNWNDKNSSDVAKERIWKEYCIAESRELRVFDSYREPRFATRGACSPISVRSPDFMDRTSVLLRSVCGTVLPQVRQRSVQRLIRPPGRGEPSPSNDEVTSPTSTVSERSPSPGASSSLRQRPTSSQEIGSCLVPLVPRNSRHFHYGIKKIQLTPTYVVN